MAAFATLLPWSGLGGQSFCFLSPGKPEALTPVWPLLSAVSPAGAGMGLTWMRRPRRSGDLPAGSQVQWRTDNPVRQLVNLRQYRPSGSDRGQTFWLPWRQKTEALAPSRGPKHGEPVENSSPPALAVGKVRPFKMIQARFSGRQSVRYSGEPLSVTR